MVWFLCCRSVWADFLTDDPKAWMMRIGEHNMFKDQGTHVDVEPVKIIFHPDRNREYPNIRHIVNSTNHCIWHTLTSGYKEPVEIIFHHDRVWAT